MTLFIDLTADPDTLANRRQLTNRKTYGNHWVACAASRSPLKWKQD